MWSTGVLHIMCFIFFPSSSFSLTLAKYLHIEYRSERIDVVEEERNIFTGYMVDVA